jgi:hypothetical protein
MQKSWKISKIRAPKNPHSKFTDEEYKEVVKTLQ